MGGFFWRDYYLHYSELPYDEMSPKIHNYLHLIKCNLFLELVSIFYVSLQFWFFNCLKGLAQ